MLAFARQPGSDLCMLPSLHLASLPRFLLRHLVTVLVWLGVLALLVLGVAGLTSAALLARVQSQAATPDGYTIQRLTRRIEIEHNGKPVLSAKLSGPGVLRAQVSTHAELDVRLQLEPQRLDLRALLDARIKKQINPLAQLGRFRAASAEFAERDIAISASVPVTLSLGLLPGAKQSWPTRITARATPEAKDGRLSLRLRYSGLSIEGSTPLGMLDEARKRAREKLNRRLYPRLALPAGWRVLEAKVEGGALVVRLSYYDAHRPWFCSPKGLQSPLACGLMRGLAAIWPSQDLTKA